MKPSFTERIFPTVFLSGVPRGVASATSFSSACTSWKTFGRCHSAKKLVGISMGSLASSKMVENGNSTMKISTIAVALILLCKYIIVYHHWNSQYDFIFHHISIWSIFLWLPEIYSYGYPWFLIISLVTSLYITLLLVHHIPLQYYEPPIITIIRILFMMTLIIEYSWIFNLQ